MEDNERDGAQISGDQKNYKEEEGLEAGVTADRKTESDTGGDEYVETKTTGDEKLEDDSRGDEKLEDHTVADVAIDADMKCYENVADDENVDDATEGIENVDAAPEGIENLDAATEGDENVDAAPEGDENVDAAPEGDKNVDAAPEGDENVDAAPEGDENVDAATEGDENVDAAPEGDENVDAAPEGDEQLSLSPDLIVFQLYYFAKCGRCDKLQEMIYKKGFSINATNANGRSALMLATEWNDEPAKEILLENGALRQLSTTVISDVLKNEPIQDICVRQVFEGACLEDSFKEFLNVVLHEGGIDINELNQDGQSALMMAVETYQSIAVTVLLAAGAIVSEQVVRRALDLKYFEILEELLRSGPTLCDTLWLELLQLTSCAAHKALVESEQRAKSRFTETQLARAVRLRSVEAVSRLTEAGIDINMADSDGRTALHAAVIHGDVEILKVLIRIGAEVNIKDNTSNTPLDLAFSRDNVGKEVVQVLKFAGAISGLNI